MSGETEQDPSGLSVDNLNNQVDRSIKAERDWVIAQLDVAGANLTGEVGQLVQRLDDMDKANTVLAENVNRVPTNLQAAIGGLKELENVKFEAIADRFELLDKQTVREKAAADLALAAAFNAADKSAVATNDANAEAIRKSELATAETIKTNEQARIAGNTALSDKIEDVKDRQNRIEQLIASIQANSVGGSAKRDDYRATIAIVVAVLAVVASIVIGIFAATGR